MQLLQSFEFDRKHYYYADLPAGYQITQAWHPIASGGTLSFDVPLRSRLLECHQSTGVVPIDILTASSQGNKIRQSVGCIGMIDRIQLEQDSGKSSHTLSAQQSLVDFNRAGVALLEIVTQPSLHSADEAGAFLRTLHQLLRHIHVTEGNIEEGNMRCDVNVSLRHVPRAMQHDLAALSPDALGFAAESALAQLSAISTGPRVEMKNVASIKAVEKAIEFEVSRQIGILDASGWNGKQQIDFPFSQETRLYDMALGASTRLRGKETAVDYRFLPEPDVMPVLIPSSLIDTCQEEL
jgi:aspartyl-tRNA(Asn)/glutamyl-tRNA(Gln) amidotransferase subunit B